VVAIAFCIRAIARFFSRKVLAEIYTEFVGTENNFEMTKFPHDQFAKDYLKELLTPFGMVEASRNVVAEVREFDVWFKPYSSITSADTARLGLLGQFAAVPAVFEPFRNAVTPDLIRDCMGKLYYSHTELQRQAKREKTRISEADLPMMWIFTPTASASILNGFKATVEDGWSPGVYFQGELHKTGIVVIHQLPSTPETLWVRILGKGNVQKQAIQELNALPVDHRSRSEALLLLANLRTNLLISQNVNKEDQELIVELSPVLVQQLEAATREGEQRGIQTGRRDVVESSLLFRYGVLDEQLLAIIQPIVELPTTDFTRLLMQLSNLSREELLARFGR
jgi:hypothetical protein